MLTRRAFLGAGAGLVLAGSSTAAYAGYVEPAMRLVVTRYRLTPPGWPADLPLRIAVIADLHAGGPNITLRRVAEIVAATNELKPDLIVNLGDHVSDAHFSTVVPPAEWAAALAELSAPLGVYTVLGNHDWWHEPKVIRRAIERVRLPILENDAVPLSHRGRRVWLLGLGDQLAHRLGGGRFRGVDDLPGALAKATTDDPAILLAHEPDIFVDVPARVSLTLSGHTHGGQIWFPGMPPVFIPSAYGARFRYGHIVEGGRHLIVSGGLGTSGIPVRFGVPPEIVLVELGVVGAAPPA
jgi:predicted MPP superfamily phosphohydrolase